MYRRHVPTFDEVFPVNVEVWLDTATKLLASWERSRIADEIRGHVDDVVADAVAKGEDEESARRKAVLALGSPRNAHREYRKVRCPREHEFSLMNFKRYMVYQEYSLLHKWMYMGFIHFWVVAIMIGSWVLTFHKPIYVIFALTATGACVFRYLCYQVWFPKWLAGDLVHKTMVMKAVSSNLCWFAVAVFYLTYGWSFDFLLFYVYFCLFYNPMVVPFTTSPLPKDLKWSEIRTSVWDNR